MAPRRSRPGEARIAFEALSIEGGLLGAEWLGRVAQLQAPAQEPADYHIPKGLEIRDEIARGWRIAQACFHEFEAGRASGGDAPALAGQFMEALLRDALGFASLAGAAPGTIGDRVYPVRFFALGERVPIVVAPAAAGLDTPLPELGDEQRRRTAFGLLQEVLNASDAALWGLASDGLSLRVARDNASLTRPAWIEADLGRIFAEELYPDFAALWLLAHESRFGRADAPDGTLPLEEWREAGRQEGTRARDKLSAGFQQALEILGQGFLSDASNKKLRSALHAGTSQRIATSSSSCGSSTASSFCSPSKRETCCIRRRHPAAPAGSMHRDTLSAACETAPFAGARAIATGISGRRSRSPSGVSRVENRVSDCPPWPACSRRRRARTSTRRRSTTPRFSTPCSTWRGFASPRGWSA